MRIQLLPQTGSGDNLFEQTIRECLGDFEFEELRGLIAFVTTSGLLRLGLGQGALNDFAERGKLDLVVGIDAVTSDDALRRLNDLAGSTGHISRVRVADFSDMRGIFHPKLFLFTKSDGSGTVIIGSNNLTENGLGENAEFAVAIHELSPAEITNWLQAIEECSALAIDINDALLERVKLIRSGERRSWRRPIEGDETTIPIEREVTTGVSEFDVLIRAIPRAGERTSQVHFERESAERFFRAPVGVERTIRLQQIQPESDLPAIEYRPVVFSDKNMNYKVELAGARILEQNYPSESRPIAVIEWTDEDLYRYLILVPGDDGYEGIYRLLEAESFSRGPALPSLLTTKGRLLLAWPEYPS